MKYKLLIRLRPGQKNRSFLNLGLVILRIISEPLYFHTLNESLVLSVGMAMGGESSIQSCFVFDI